jgi:putative copper export protein
VFVHTLHVVLAGTWLGGLVFTTFVVSPALKAMSWGEAERVGVRSAIGRQYARVGTANLVLLLLFALLDGAFAGYGPIFYTEYGLLAVLFGLVALHGAYLGQRLRRLAEGERKARGEQDEKEARSLAARRRSLQKTSSGVSAVDLVVSLAIAVLAVLAVLAVGLA